MNEPKIKTYYLMVARTFPAYHPKAGKQTYFSTKIFDALMTDYKYPFSDNKRHTIRQNYELWEKRFEEINAGRALLSLRYWEGKPYFSVQKEFMKLYNTDGIGLQKLTDADNFVYATIDGKVQNWEDLAKNDGLSFDDFCEWFKERSKAPMAVIHFTNFRY